LGTYTLRKVKPKEVKLGDVVTWGTKNMAYVVTYIYLPVIKVGGKTYDLEHYLDGERKHDVYSVYKTDTKPFSVLEEVLWVLDFMPDVEDQFEIAPHDRKKIASDGSSTGYYAVPDHATELRHLISHKGMSKSRGDIFKACYRLGEKDGVDTLYDLNKMKFFIEDLIEMHSRGEHL
jgi:hypothetical protein